MFGNEGKLVQSNPQTSLAVPQSEELVYNEQDYSLYLKHLLKEKQMIIFSSTFSKDGNWFLASNNFGSIALWNIGTYFQNGFFFKEELKIIPDHCFQAHQYGAIYSIVSSQVDDLIISAGESGIVGWNFSKLINNETNYFFKLNNSSQSGAHKIWGLNREFETNSVIFDQEKPNLLYSASGDSCAYVWDLNTLQTIGTFSGHTDYLHCVIEGPNGQLVTGSEDGTIRFWDKRTFKQTKMIQTTKTGDNWVSCIAFDTTFNFMACGGGTKYISLYHIPSNSVVAYMPSYSNTQTLLFHDDNILSGGNENRTYFWKKNGTLIRNVTCSPHSVFSLNVNQEPSKRVLAVCGTGQWIDMLMGNFGTITFSLKFTNFNS